MSLEEIIKRLIDQQKELGDRFTWCIVRTTKDGDKEIQSIHYDKESDEIVITIL